MPRRLRWCLAGISQQIVKLGNQRQVCFASDAGVAACINWLQIQRAINGRGIDESPCKGKEV